MVRRRPVTLQDICNGLGLHANETLKVIQQLLRRTRLTSRIHRGKRYYE